MADLIMNVQVIKKIVTVVLIIIQSGMIIRHTLEVVIVARHTLRVRTCLTNHALLIQIIYITNSCLLLFILWCGA
jgi:hypothetical protein